MMELIDLRYILAMDRIREIRGEHLTEPAFEQYFEEGASWFLLMEEEERFLLSKEAETADTDTLREKNRKLYEEILPENYATSWANPDYAAGRLGEEMGPLLAALRYESRSVIPFVYRHMRERVLIRAELFLEVYTAFTVAYRENGGTPSPDQIRSIMRQYLADYAEDETFSYLQDKLVEGSERIYDLAVNRAEDVRNLYLTGEYVTDDEILSAEHLAGLSQETITLLADAITERYRRGFINGGRNPASKKNVAVIARLGFERIVRSCVQGFSKLGLKVILSAEVPTLFHSFMSGNMGYGGANPNPQYYYDHREDLALFLDESLRIRRLEGLGNAYRRLREKTVLYAGSVALETFDTAPFAPAHCVHAPKYSKAQQKICREYSIRSEMLCSEAGASKDSSTVSIYPDGRVVPAGTEILNAPLEEMGKNSEN